MVIRIWLKSKAHIVVDSVAEGAVGIIVVEVSVAKQGGGLRGSSSKNLGSNSNC